LATHYFCQTVICSGKAESGADALIPLCSGLARTRALPILAAVNNAFFRHPHRVTYADCTVGNHVYYGRYLDLLEEARGEFFRHVGQPLLQWQGHDRAFPVIECRLRYLAPARYDDVLTIETWIMDVERVRLNVAYRIVNQDGREILRAETFHVCTSLEEKPRRLPEQLRSALLPHVRTGPRPD
jgi:acyl-CoA thioester hydrolase